MNTRIAPSPTGMFHIGTARTAYFNWLAARSTGGKFILRIDDTDLARNNDDYVNLILDAMAWLKLDYDAVYSQSQRLGLYHSMANLLIDNDHAKKLDNGAIALINPIIPRQWHDSIAGMIDINDQDRALIDGLILIKGDGMPTYNFSTVVDDLDMGIDWIIRGVDHINNTPKQVAIQLALTWSMGRTTPTNIQYTHVGLIHKDGKKLSKRDGAASVLDYRDMGYDPNALLNFLLKMGWSATDPNFDRQFKTITMDVAFKYFIDHGKLRASPANFDQDKLDWYDRKYKLMMKSSVMQTG